jgi:C1A family cysteine protease
MAGALPEAEFPYVASDAPCGGPYSHPNRVTSWAILSPEWGIASVADIKQAIYDHGPVGVAICAGSGFDGYSGGIFATDESSACDGGVNHAVVLVGWDDAEGMWILRNSWGPWWGESGYMRIVWGTSNVGYSTNYISYISTQPPDNWAYLPLVVTSSP